MFILSTQTDLIGLQFLFSFAYIIAPLSDFCLQCRSHPIGAPVFMATTRIPHKGNKGWLLGGPVHHGREDMLTGT